MNEDLKAIEVLVNAWWKDNDMFAEPFRDTLKKLLPCHKFELIDSHWHLIISNA